MTGSRRRNRGSREDRGWLGRIGAHGNRWPLVALALAALLLGLRLLVPPSAKHVPPAEHAAVGRPAPASAHPRAAHPATPMPPDEDTAERLADEAYAARAPLPEPPPGQGPAAAARPAAPRAATPAWLSHALPAPPLDGRPRIAVVIDDLGLDKPRT